MKSQWDETALTDTHCHVSQWDKAQWQTYYDRAVNVGVKNFVWVSTDHASYEKTKTVVGAVSPATVSLGMHPHEAKTYDISTWEKFFESEDYIAVGECGLDYHYNYSPPEDQKTVFQHHLSMAAEHKKPVIVHIRDAFEDALPLIQQAAKQGVVGVVHCFTGNSQQIEVILDAGWYVGFTGIITFKKSTEFLIDALKVAPIDRVFLETDSPYLAPHPYRGKPNEPSYLPHVAEKVSEIKGLSLPEVTKITTANATALFLGE